jgi:hypothetical protein
MKTKAILQANFNFVIRAANSLASFSVFDDYHSRFIGTNRDNRRAKAHEMVIAPVIFDSGLAGFVRIADADPGLVMLDDGTRWR